LGVETIDANRRLNVVAGVTFGAKRKVPRCREGVKWAIKKKISTFIKRDMSAAEY
jgi:hypothetical protein